VIARYILKFITSPRSIGNTIRAGLNVVGYGFGDIVRRRLNKFIGGTRYKSALRGLAKSKLLK
jgi:hypothetical protein